MDEYRKGSISSQKEKVGRMVGNTKHYEHPIERARRFVGHGGVKVTENATPFNGGDIGSGHPQFYAPEREEEKG